MRQPVVATALSWWSLSLQQQDPFVFELRIFVRAGRETLVDTADQRCDLAGLENCLADGGRLVLPRLEECVAVGLRERRRDRGQLLVGVLVESGVGGDDQIGFQAGDLLHLNSVVQVQHNRFGVAEFGQGPGPHPEWLIAEPVCHRDRHDPERQQIVLPGEPGADHPLGWLGDGRFTENVRDGHRPAAAGGGGRWFVRRAGRGGGNTSSPAVAPARKNPRRFQCSCIA